LVGICQLTYMIRNAVPDIRYGNLCPEIGDNGIKWDY
jgi:hypothetical protein